MAFASLNDLVDATKQRVPYFKTGAMPTAAAGAYTSYWAAPGGIPAAGSLAVGNTTSGAIPTKATTGALPFNNPGIGATSYLARLSGSANQICAGMLFDRAWHAGSFTPTAGAIAGFTGATLPDRPTDGAFEPWIEINTAFSALAHTVTLTYTNQDGTTGRTGTVALPASAPASRMFQVSLQGNDTGVRSVQAISGSASPPTGSFNLLLLRHLGELRFGVVNMLEIQDAVACNFVEIANDSCIMLVILSTGSTAPNPINMRLDISAG